MVGSRDGWQFVAFTARSGDEFIGSIIVDELFDLGIPLELPSEFATDVDQVANRSGPMSRFGIGRRFLAGTDAVDEVGDVRDRLIRTAGCVGRSVFE